MTLLEQFDPLRLWWPGTGALGRAFLPPADLIATPEEVTIVMDVPGLKADDLSIELTGNVLTVTGERGYPYTAGEQRQNRWHRLERSFGKFQRTLQVPDGLDPEHISATVADGVLTLRIPQPEHRKPRRIQITTAGQAPAIEAELEDSEPFDTAPSEERELVGAGV